MLAAALDQPVGRVQEVTVHSEPRSASSLLLAGWLRKRLHVPTKIVHDKGPGITKVVLKTTQGEVSLSRPDGRVAQLAIPHAPESPVALPRRNMAELLAEELRRLDPDEIYYQALKGIESVLHPPVKEAKSKVKSGTSSAKSKKTATSKAKSATTSAKPKSTSGKPKSSRAASKPTAANSKKKSK
ncbi:MAG: hypothetical protein EBQ78_01900 [Betaproteobacteria bacterium]|nr:hypothetical protein [Betaproteobacteria bacterium]